MRKSQEAGTSSREVLPFLFVGKTKPSLLMKFCQNLNNAKLLPVFQNFILLTNLNLKQKIKWGFILYRGSCDKVVSWYIFHARLGSYIIFAKISIQIFTIQNIHQNQSLHWIQVCFLQEKFWQDLFSINLSCRCPAQEEISSIYHSRSSPPPL